MPLLLPGNKTIKWLSLPPILKQVSFGGGSVELGIMSPPPISWDLGLCQYLSGDGLS